MARRKGIDRSAQEAALQEMANQIAGHFQVSRSHVRYAAYQFFGPSGWTVQYSWERLVDGNWLAVDWQPPLHSSY